MTVELESTSASVENAAFRTSDGAVDYKIDASGFKNRTTEITKHGQSVGRIVMHNFSSDEIIVNGTSIKLALKGKFTTKKFFQASDNQKYTWKATYEDAKMTDEQERVVAQYKMGSNCLFRKSRPSTLHIAEALIPVMDEVFATFIYMSQEARVRTTVIAASA